MLNSSGRSYCVHRQANVFGHSRTLPIVASVVASAAEKRSYPNSIEYVPSIRKKLGSKYWFACFALPDGTRVQRSTKETDRKKAQKLADNFEEVARLQMTARQAQRVISEIFQRVNGDSLPSTSVRSYFESWLVRKKSETANSTHIFYSGKARRFLNWLGDRAERQLITVTRGDILTFRESEEARVNPSTANHGIKVLRMIFQDAKRDGIIADNPAEGVKRVSGTNRAGVALSQFQKSNSCSAWQMPNGVR